MEYIKFYLPVLRNRIFKLLPMKEGAVLGLENHYEEYLDNLQANCLGLLHRCPELLKEKEIVEAINNLEFLKCNPLADFRKTRSMILRSTRLIQTVINRYEEE